MRSLLLVAAIAAGCNGNPATDGPSDGSIDPDAAAPTCPQGSHLAPTQQGCVRGAPAGTVEVFKGIPYAAPPVGALRWRPPAPAVMRSGVFDALAFSPYCAQNPSSFDGTIVPWSEDCLTLNIWTPNLDHVTPGGLPVMVWIHGGGLYEGGSSDWNYDGQRLADQGRVVVVSINYRLGPLGYLAHPALSAEDPAGVSGNYGLLDQIAALAWVRDNIGFFGGAADNVTMFGESAGGFSVCALLVAPPAVGLFHRAIIESAKCQDYGIYARDLKVGRPPQAPESAEAQGVRFATALGCTSGDLLACMRAKSADQVLAALPGDVVHGGELFGYVVDGKLFADSPRKLILGGGAARVPVIAGTNTDEGTAFTTTISVPTAAAYNSYVQASFPRANEVLALYPASDFATPHDALAALVGDISFICPDRQVLRALVQHDAAVYSYLFGYVTALGAYLGWGAYHSAEIEFVFGSLRSRPSGIPAASADELALSDAMLAYWARFAATGDPNGAGTPAWTPFDAVTGPYQSFTATIATQAELKTAKCNLLEQLY